MFIKVAFWLNVISFIFQSIVIFDGNAVQSSNYVFLVCNVFIIVYHIIYNPCEIGLHQWDVWQHYLVSMQIRKCKICGKTQVVR
jgi:hypothetical protein